MRPWSAVGEEDSPKGISDLRAPATPLSNECLRWVCLTLLAEVPWAAGCGPCRLFALWLPPSATPRAGQATQAAYGVGMADALVGKTLAARARDRGRATVGMRLKLWIVAGIWGDPSPSSPALGSMPLCTNRLRHASRTDGRPRLKGERLANLSAVLEDPKTAWTPITLSSWYGGAQRTVEIVSETAIWYSTGLPAVPIRWVLIRDPEGDFESQALLCTDLSAEPARIISWFVRRWQMESTFQEVRQRLGFETQRQWSQMAIQRTAPALLTLFSLVALFADQRRCECHRPCGEQRGTRRSIRPSQTP